MNKWIFIVSLLVGCLIGSWIFFLTREPKVIEKTVVDVHWDTTYIEKPVPVTVYKDREVIKEVPVEKVIVRDSICYVTLDKEVKQYKDSTYYLQISGIEPELDFIETYQKTTTITNNIIKKPLVVIGPSISLSYDPWRNQFNNSIGISVVIPVYSIYR